jgi:hypothetical protein
VSPIGCYETSVTNYQPSLCNLSEEQKLQCYIDYVALMVRHVNDVHNYMAVEEWL